jgi:hypothetical protein
MHSPPRDATGDAVTSPSDYREIPTPVYPNSDLNYRIAGIYLCLFSIAEIRPNTGAYLA